MKGVHYMCPIPFLSPFMEIIGGFFINLYLQSCVLNKLEQHDLINRILSKDLDHLCCFGVPVFWRWLFFQFSSEGVIWNRVHIMFYFILIFCLCFIASFFPVFSCSMVGWTLCLELMDKQLTKFASDLFCGHIYNLLPNLCRFDFYLSSRWDPPYDSVHLHINGPSTPHGC